MCVLLGLVLLVQTAVAQIPEAPAPGDLLAEVESASGGALRIEGAPERPTLVQVTSPEGDVLFRYASWSDGTVSIDAAGETLIRDATLLRLEGDPVADARFALVLREVQGKETRVDVDRSAFEAAPKLDGVEVDLVKITREIGVYGGPNASHLQFVMAGEALRLRPGELDGARYLPLAGAHTAILQIPKEEQRFQNIVANATLNNNTHRLGFAFSHQTHTFANVHRVDYLPSTIAQARDGDVLALRIEYERRATPIVVERFVDPVTYRYKLDGSPPSVALATSETSPTYTFGVAWSGSDAASGIASFDVHYRTAGATSWLPWLTRATDTSAYFSGAWDTTYEFRARSYDRVGNPSDWSPTRATRVAAQPAGEDDVNEPPLARFLEPRAGSTLSGLAQISWQASDPDGKPVTSTLEVSEDDGRTWRVLATGGATSFAWDTLRELDAATYRLRVSVSDGALSATDVVSGLSVANVRAAGGSSPDTVAPTQSPGGVQGGAGDEGTGAPTPGGGADVDPQGEPGSKETPLGLAVPLAAIAAAMLLRRR